MDAQSDLSLTPDATPVNWLPENKDCEFASLVIYDFF